jgi:hypothetical protein
MCRDPQVSTAAATVFRQLDGADAAADHTLLPAEGLDIPGIDEAMVEFLAGKFHRLRPLSRTTKQGSRPFHIP